MLFRSHSVKTSLRPGLFTPTELGSVGAPQHHWFCLGILYLIMIYAEGEGHKAKKTIGERNRRSSRAKPVARDTDTSDLLRM